MIVVPLILNCPSKGIAVDYNMMSCHLIASLSEPLWLGTLIQQNDSMICLCTQKPGANQRDQKTSQRHYHLSNSATTWMRQTHDHTQVGKVDLDHRSSSCYYHVSLISLTERRVPDRLQSWHWLLRRGDGTSMQFHCTAPLRKRCPVAFRTCRLTTSSSKSICAAVQRFRRVPNGCALSERSRGSCMQSLCFRSDQLQREWQAEAWRLAWALPGVPESKWLYTMTITNWVKQIQDLTLHRSYFVSQSVG